MPKVKRIDHLAVLVDDMETALAFWRDALGLELEGLHEIPEEAAEIAFLPLGGSEVELVRPTSSDSGLARYLEKRGPGMHHLCLEVENIDEMLAHLQGQGLELINPEAKVGAGGRKYAFIHPKSAFGVLVELYEYPSEVKS